MTRRVWSRGRAGACAIVDAAAVPAFAAAAQDRTAAARLLVAGNGGSFAELTLSVRLPGHSTTTHVQEVQRLLAALETTIRREIQR